MTFDEWWSERSEGFTLDEEIERWAREAWVESRKHGVLKQLREVGAKRSRESYKTEAGGPSFYGFAAVGELGELYNLLKKFERVRLGGPDGGHTITAADITKEMINDEVGGFMAYFDRLLAHYEVDIEEATATTFNRVSEEIGSPHRILLDLDEYVEEDDRPTGPKSMGIRTEGSGFD